MHRPLGIDVDRILRVVEVGEVGRRLVNAVMEGREGYVELEVEEEALHHFC